MNRNTYVELYEDVMPLADLPLDETPLRGAACTYEYVQPRAKWGGGKAKANGDEGKGDEGKGDDKGKGKGDDNGKGTMARYCTPPNTKFIGIYSKGTGARGQTLYSSQWRASPMGKAGKAGKGGKGGKGGSGDKAGDHGTPDTEEDTDTDVSV
jgi:hypothetical protein